MDRSINPENFNTVQAWLKQCYNQPRDTELVLCAINEILDGYGIEVIETEEYIIRASYVNLVDSYVPTVIRDYKKGRWIINCTGDFIEINNLEERACYEKNS